MRVLPCQVDDDNFKKLVAIIRIAVPYTGMILSTRESAEMRDELLKVSWWHCAATAQLRGVVHHMHRVLTPAGH